MNRAAQKAIVFGIGVGFAYQLGLASTQISVCERQRPGKCDTEWAQGFAVSSGLLSTLLAYFIEAPGAQAATTKRRPANVRPPQDDSAAPPP